MIRNKKYLYSSRYIYMTNSLKELGKLISACQDAGLAHYWDAHNGFSGPNPSGRTYTGILIDLDESFYHLWLLESPATGKKVSLLEFMVRLEKETNERTFTK